MSKNTGTSELINYFDLGANGDVGIAGSLDVNTIANATTDTDKFLVSDTGIIKYRTGAELLSDILTNPVTGTGTTNYLPKFTGASTIGNSNLINDASGNLGLGVTPSAWSILSPAIEIGTGGSFISAQGSTSAIYIGTNAFFNGSNFIYKTNGAATYSIQNAGSHQWLVAPSGTAGNAITFTTPMTLFSDGNLILTNGTVTNAGFKLDVNGTGRFSGQVDSSIFNSTSNAFRFSGNNALSLVTLSGQNVVKINAAGYWGSQIVGQNDQGLLINNTGAATFSNVVNANSSGQLKLESNNETTNFAYANFLNTSGFLRWGVENSSGGGLFSGTSAYSSVIGSVTDRNFHIATNGATRLTITSGGNVLIGTTTDNGAKLQVNGDIRTAAPTGATASNFRVGTITNGALSTNASVRMDINGTPVNVLIAY